MNEFITARPSNQGGGGKEKVSDVVSLLINPRQKKEPSKPVPFGLFSQRLENIKVSQRSLERTVFSHPQPEVDALVLPLDFRLRRWRAHQLHYAASMKDTSTEHMRSMLRRTKAELFRVAAPSGHGVYLSIEYESGTTNYSEERTQSSWWSSKAMAACALRETVLRLLAAVMLQGTTTTVLSGNSHFFAWPTLPLMEDFSLQLQEWLLRPSSSSRINPEEEGDGEGVLVQFWRKMAGRAMALSKTAFLGKLREQFPGTDETVIERFVIRCNPTKETVSMSSFSMSLGVLSDIIAPMSSNIWKVNLASMNVSGGSTAEFVGSDTSNLASPQGSSDHLESSTKEPEDRPWLLHQALCTLAKSSLSLEEYSFDVFAYCDEALSPLVGMVYATLNSLGLLGVTATSRDLLSMPLNPAAVVAFSREIELGYLDNAYHNATHATSVVHSCHYMLTR